MTHCTLCEQPLSSLNSSKDGSNGFCCIGCQTVYTILSSRGLKTHFRNHPLFGQAVRNGLISNPHLFQEIETNEGELRTDELTKLYFEICDLWCPSCAEIIRLVLLKEKGVVNCVVDYATDLASVEYSPRCLSKEKILSLIKEIGYTPALFQDERKKDNFFLYLRFIVAAFFSLNVMMFSYPIYASYFSLDTEGYGVLFSWLSFAASLPVLIFCGWPIVKRFSTSILLGCVGMETLIVIGISTSFGLSLYDMAKGGHHVYFDSMTVIIAFQLLGKMVESKAKLSLRETLCRLSRSLPKRGRKVFDDGRELFVPLKEVKVGEILVALSGEKVVLDGEVVEGEAGCDESLMTGEAMPVRKQKGDKVVGGTIITKGRILFRATTDQEGTALHHIIQTIQSDIGGKTSYERAVDPIIKVFVPVVILFAMATTIAIWFSYREIESAVLRGISILLISCPCAIGIAAPLAESRTLYSMANLGAVIRNRSCLPFLGKEDIFLFDKTGTITEGHFRVTRGLNGLTLDDSQIVKSMCHKSTHPIAVALSRALNVSLVPIDRCEEVIGRGMKAFSNGRLYLLGSEDFLKQEGMKFFSEEDPSICGKEIETHVFFANGQEVHKIVLADRVKTDAKEVIQELGPERTGLISGDSEKAVQAVATICGFNHWKSRCSPLDKKTYVDSLRQEGQIVCIMGDGINDALALTAAHIGISVVTATDLSQQVSDVMLTTDRLNILPRISALAKRGRRIVYQNLFWAFFYNVVGIGIAAAGYLTPLIASFAMVLSSIIVTFNAQRIR